jgi:hypothetical protein
MKILCAFLFCMAGLVDTATAKSCAAMTQELARLRSEYHSYVSRGSKESNEITFDGLVAILDKIVALKNDMRKAEPCPIPPRPKNFSERR